MLDFDSSELYVALSFLKDVVPTSPHIAVLGHVLFEPGEKSVKLYGRDIDRIGMMEIPAVVTDNRRFIVPMTKLFPIVAGLKKTDDLVRFELTRTAKSLKIFSEDDSSITLRLMGEDNYPEMRTPTGKQFSLHSEDFVDMLFISAFTQSDKTMLTNIHMMSDEKILILEAMNGFSGGKVELATNLMEFDLAVPGTMAKPLNKLNRLSSGNWSVYIDERALFIESFYNDWFIGFHTMDGKYIDISRIYNNSNVNELVIDKSELVNNLKLLGVVSDNNFLQLDIQTDIIELSVSSATGKGNRFISIPPGEETNSIKVDIVELQRVLQQIQSETVTIKIGTNQEPILIIEQEKTFFIVPLL